MNVVLASAWRNSVQNVRPYAKRVEDLRVALGPSNSLRVLAAEGDSKDATRSALLNVGFTVVDASHGCREFGSTEEPERLRALSHVFNTIVANVYESDDVLVYVESDLRWDAQTLKALAQDVQDDRNDFWVVAPMVMAGQAFYDIWGFRKLDGQRFGPLGPWPTELTEVSSVGSCFAAHADVARSCRIRNDYALVGWCEDVRAHDFRIAVRPDLAVHQL